MYSKLEDNDLLEITEHREEIGFQEENDKIKGKQPQD